MADETSEVAAIKSRIQSWLQQNQNQFQLDLTKDPIDFNQHSGTLFTGNQGQTTITLGFTVDNLNKNSTFDQFRSTFNFIALNRLSLPGLDGIPAQWEIYPQTPMSSFYEGVTFENYDPNTQVLQLTVQTNFFAVYGKLPQQDVLMDAPASKGTYLQVRQDFQGIIKLRAKLVFN